MPTDEVTAFCEALWRRQHATVAVLARRVDPNGKGRWGRTPLLMAAQWGDLALVARLIRRGAEVDQQRRYLTPVTLAARQKASDIVAFLTEKGATVSIVTAIYLGDHKRCARELKREPALASLRDEEGTPLLHHAVEALWPALAALVLGHGGSVSDVDAKGETGLHRIADMRRAPQGAAAKMAGLLLDHGADPNARNWDDVTPSIRRFAQETSPSSSCSSRAAPIPTRATRDGVRRHCAAPLRQQERGERRAAAHRCDC